MLSIQSLPPPRTASIMASSRSLALALLVAIASLLQVVVCAEGQSRVFILTDVSNEPDDQESLVRLVSHSDLYTIEGIVATTSTWLRNRTDPEAIYGVLDGYASVVDNLNAHSIVGFPSAECLRSRVKTGHSVYGLASLQRNLSDGADLLIQSVDNSTEPLYVQAWGGVAVLAEALAYVQRTRSAESLAIFVSRIRLYSISDQDDAGQWIRRQFPELRYIVSIHGFNMYGHATWVGISGEQFYHFDKGGPNSSLVSKSFIAKHFQRGPLGDHYLTPAFIMEGDSPAMLYNMQNGLNTPEHPEYGSWGGRYTLMDISGATQIYSDGVDYVTGVDNQTHSSGQATVWRWRQAYQYEFANRMAWSLTSDYSACIHPPKVTVNGSRGCAPMHMTAAPGAQFTLDASASVDPDSNGTGSLDYEWFHYQEPTLEGRYSDYNPPNHVPHLNFTCSGIDCSIVSFNLPDADSACPNVDGSCQSYHVVVAVTAKVEMPMTRYKRVIVEVQKNGTVV